MTRPSARGGSAQGAAISACFVLLLAMLAALAQLNPAVAVGLAIGVTTLTILGLDRTGELVVFLGVLTAPLNRLGFGGADVSVSASDLLLLLGFTLLLPHMVAGKRIHVPALFLIGAAGLLCTGAIASLAGATPLLSLVDLVRLLVASFAIPVLFLWWAPPLRTVSWLVLAYIGGNLFNIFYAQVDSNPYQAVRAFGLTTHFNNYALTSLLALTLLPFALRTTSPRWTPALYLAGLLCFYGVWESGSRAALLVIGVAGCLFLVVERWGRLAWLAAAGSCVVALTWSSIASTDSQSALSRLLGGSASANSDRERTEALEAGWAAFWERPLLGRGYAHVIDYHNVYVAVAVAAGIFGLAFFLIFLLSGISLIATMPRPVALLGYPVLAYALFASLSTNLWDRFVWVVIALALSARRTVVDPPTEATADTGTKQAGADDQPATNGLRRTSARIGWAR